MLQTWNRYDWTPFAPSLSTTTGSLATARDAADGRHATWLSWSPPEWGIGHLWMQGALPNLRERWPVAGAGTVSAVDNLRDGAD